MKLTEVMIVGYVGRNPVCTASIEPETATVALTCADADDGKVWATWEGDMSRVFAGAHDLVQELMHDAMNGSGQ